MSKKRDEQWSELFESAMTEVATWRKTHPKAKFNEIEEKLDNKLAQVRRQLLQDLAQSSSATDIRGLEAEKRPLCPECKVPLVANGQQERELTTTYDQVVKLERSYGRCPQCGRGFFPP